jgi:hypothetical protein
MFLSTHELKIRWAGFHLILFFFSFGWEVTLLSWIWRLFLIVGYCSIDMYTCVNLMPCSIILAKRLKW